MLSGMKTQNNWPQYRLGNPRTEAGFFVSGQTINLFRDSLVRCAETVREPATGAILVLHSLAGGANLRQRSGVLLPRSSVESTHPDGWQSLLGCRILIRRVSAETGAARLPAFASAYCLHRDAAADALRVSLAHHWAGAGEIYCLSLWSGAADRRFQLCVSAAGHDRVFPGRR